MMDGAKKLLEIYIEKQRIKKLIKKHQKEIDSISSNLLELKTNSNNIKEEINKIKIVPLRDNLFIVSKEQKDKLENYIDKVNKTTDDYRAVKEFFKRLINLKKMFHRKDKEDVYVKVVENLYNNQIISEKTFDKITG